MGGIILGQLVHFDIAALAILLVVMLTSIYRKMYKDMSSVVFLSMVGTTLLASLLESALVIMYAAGCRDDSAFMIVKSFYMLSHDFAAVLYFLYVISLANTWHKMRQYPAVVLLMCIPYFVNIASIVVNAFNGWMFTFENGIESMHSNWLNFLCAGVYILVSIYYVIDNRRLFKRHQMLALASMLPLTVAAFVVRQFYPNSLVALFANALGILIMSTVIQRPELFVDTLSQQKKYSFYADNMKKVFMNKNHVTMILVNISSYSSIYHILGYDETTLLLRRIGNYIEGINRRLNAYASVYYLDRGRFRVVINSFNTDKVRKYAFEVNELLKEKLYSKNIEVSLNAVVCVARCPEDLHDFNSLISFGNDFHEKVPVNGDVIYAEELFTQREFSLINEMDDIIDRAIENNNFKVYYQPIFSVTKQRFTSAEALLRLIDDVHGFVPPDLFITAAERNGTIHKIGSLVVEEVCRFIASDEFRRLGLEYIEINLSVAQCMQSNLADDILAMLEKYKVSVSQINLEITETAANYDMSAMSENVRKLSEAGVSFSLDDFGTGYSNIERVAALPLKLVKLDRTFVNNQENPHMSVFLENFIRMFKQMDMEIVVEGIETEQMVKRFSDLRCDYIQGYYFSKPIPQREFVEFISKQNGKKV